MSVTVTSSQHWTVVWSVNAAQSHVPYCSLYCIETTMFWVGSLGIYVVVDFLFIIFLGSCLGGGDVWSLFGDVLDCSQYSFRGCLGGRSVMFSDVFKLLLLRVYVHMHVMCVYIYIYGSLLMILACAVPCAEVPPVRLLQTDQGRTRSQRTSGRTRGRTRERTRPYMLRKACR